MLYTTYFSKMKDIPENSIKLIITRFPPKWLDISKDTNTYVVKELAPSQELLLKYKKDNNWDEYVIDFCNQMNNRVDMINMLNRVRGVLQRNIDIYLICYEKDYTRCHRSLIGEYFKEEEMKWKEL